MKIVIHMMLTLTAIGIISGGLLSQIDKWAEPRIAEHRKAETAKAVYLVQPEAKSYRLVEKVDFEVYNVFDTSNKSIGYALPYEGNGFQGKIRLMVGLNNELNKITGLQVLEQVETPGLGTKVAEKSFVNQFINLSARPFVKWIKGVPPSNNDEIQTITGATISSKAIVAILNDGLKKLRSVNEIGNKNEK